MEMLDLIHLHLLNAHAALANDYERSNCVKFADRRYIRRQLNVYLNDTDLIQVRIVPVLR